MEGIVTKLVSSKYGIGAKDNRWIKVKNYGDVIAVIGGFTLGDGGIINAVLTGLYKEGNLNFIGKVGTGKLKRSDWEALTIILQKEQISICPFQNRHPDLRGAYRVKPSRAVKVQFSEWRIHEGRMMRQPSLQAFVDIPPVSCIFES